MMIMEGYGGSPYFDPEFDTLMESIQSPRVNIDNDMMELCTLVKVDSANRHGILLQMVQLLTDLDLVISKSYITSDGGWLMDEFHVTDKLGNKLTDPSLIRFIEQSLSSGGTPGEVRTCLGKPVGPVHAVAGYTALEMTVTDRPGLLSEVATTLAELRCYIVSVNAWTHNARAALVMYLIDDESGKAMSEPSRLAYIEEQVWNVIGAPDPAGERRAVRLLGPMDGRIHTERRLHQLLRDDQDYEASPAPQPVDDGNLLTFSEIEARQRGRSSMSTQVSIDSWKEKGYSVVTVTSPDRPKLFFDTICTLTDMEYNVFHGSVSSQGLLAIQEYYVRHKDGCTLDSEAEIQRVTRCLVAAVERRVSHGLRLDVSTDGRMGLLSDVTRVLRENGLSLTRAECVTHENKASGTFYVTDILHGGDLNPKRLEALQEEIGRGVEIVVSSSSPEAPFVEKVRLRPTTAASATGNVQARQALPRFSIGNLLWSQFARLSTLGILNSLSFC